MGGLLKKALKISQLKFKTAGSAVNDGSHQTFKVSFIENGKEIEGFFKELAPKKDYPELLAKISVATSLFKRLFQGTRSAEERLVFDDNKKLLGTLSINVDGFKPFNFSNEAIPSDFNLKEQVIPSTKTLIETNAMEILLGRWFLDDDDGHPHNISLAGDIDFDMFWYWFTIHMKAPRAGIGIPKTRVNLTVDDWEHFPNVKDSKPYHWPTYKYPGQETIPSLVPAQGQILNKLLPKIYADPTQFENLASEPTAQEQKFAAALKVLLTFQPNMVRSRLTELFGDMALNYTSLDETDTNLRVTYEQTFPQLCNEKTNTKPFVEFIMSLYQEHYDNLYRVVVFYMGCKSNDYGISLPATSHALFHRPSYYKNIATWVQTQNDTVYSKEEPELKFDLPELQKRYHQVWRDAFAPKLKELLHSAYHLTTKLLRQVSSEAMLEELVGMGALDSSVTSAWQLFGIMPELSKEKVMPLICVDKESQLREGLFLLIEFTSQFNAAAKAYYEKERKNLIEEDNLVFVNQLSQLYTEYNLKIRQNLAHTSTHATEFNRIALGLKQFTEQAHFQLHLTTTDEQMKESTTAKIIQDIIPHTNEEIMKQFNNSLFMWARNLKPELLNQYITDIIDKRYVPTIGTLSYRRREKPVKDYLATSLNDSGDNRLAYIFSSGAEEAGALNTLLIQYLTPKMLQSHPLPSIRQALRDDSFNSSANLECYTKSTVAFANNDKRFIHLYSTEGIRLFYEALYEWIEQLPLEKFKGIIESALKEYEKGLWFGSGSRRAEVQGYYKLRSQAKILAITFLNGKDTSTLNEHLFLKVIEVIKKDKNMANNTEISQRPGNKLLLQFNALEHKSFYLNALKANAVGPSHKQDATTATTAPRQAVMME